jgi:hypothetical protein
LSITLTNQNFFCSGNRKKVVSKERQKMSKDTWSVNIYSRLRPSEALNNKKDIVVQVTAIFGTGILITPMNHTYQPGSTDSIESKVYGLVVRFIHTDISERRRAIRFGKSLKNQVNFNASTKKAYTNMNSANLSAGNYKIYAR